MLTTVVHSRSWFIRSTADRSASTSPDRESPRDSTGTTKWEQFIVVKGHGLIQQRNENDPEGKILEFEVSGDRIQSVIMLPGYTHNIINLSDTEDLVTVMYCNEIFDPQRPDTFFDPV